MGVKGLWKLLAPVGRPVDPQSLEGKVVGVDVSIWLYQALLGQSTPNAHLITLMRRISKLLYFKIRPIFVFDGTGVPLWKRRVLEARQLKRQSAQTRSDKAHDRLIRARLKRALKRKADSGSALSLNPDDVIDSARAQKELDMYALPSTSAEPAVEEDEDDQLISSSSSEEAEAASIDDADFESLSPNKKRERLQDMKETLWMSAGSSLPEVADDFSNFQINRILEAKKLSKRIEDINRSQDDAFLKQYFLTAKGMGMVENERGEGEGSSLYKVESIVTADGKQTFLLKDNRRKLWDKVLSSSCNEAIPEQLQKLLVEGASSAASSAASKPPTRSLPAVQLSDSSENEELEAQEDDKADVAAPALPLMQEISMKMDDKVTDSVESQAKPADQLTPHSHSDGSPSSAPPKTAKTIISDLTQITLSHVSPATSPELDVEQTKSRDPLIFGGFSADQQPILDEPSDVAPVDVHQSVKVQDTTAETVSAGDAESCEKPTDRETSLNLTPYDHAEPKPDQPVQFENEPVQLPIDRSSSKKSPVAAAAAIEPLEAIDNQSSASTDMEARDEPGRNEDDEDAEFEEVEDVDVGVAFGVKPLTPPQVDWSSAAELDREVSDLEHAVRQADRAARSVTEATYEDCQSLLRLFALPFVVAPGEAEAQCAQLEQDGVTHATFTDDSDAFLFGSQTVVRHFFDPNRHCLAYRMSEVERVLGLRRVDLCRLAMLSGCDYTLGVTGIGTVKGVEVLAEFTQKGDSGVEPLARYRSWCQAPTHTSLPRPPADAFPASFPNPEILSYFLNPPRAVPSDQTKPAEEQNSQLKLGSDPKSQFKPVWGEPDLEGLRRFAYDRIGWDEAKVESMVGESIRKWTERRTGQQTLSQFLHACQLLPGPPGIDSARVKTALSRLKNPSGSAKRDGQEPGFSGTQTIRAKKRTLPDADEARQKSISKRRPGGTGGADEGPSHSSGQSEGPSLSVKLNPSKRDPDQADQGPSQRQGLSHSAGQCQGPLSASDQPSTSGHTKQGRKSGNTHRQVSSGDSAARAAEKPRNLPAVTPRDRLQARFGKSISQGTKARLRHKKVTTRAVDNVELSEDSD